jgi:hypothetical protein
MCQRIGSFRSADPQQDGQDKDSPKNVKADFFARQRS